MNGETFNRLHNLRMNNDAAGFAMEEMRPRFAQLANRHENGTAPRAVSAYQLFQTPPAIASALVSLIGLRSGDRVLEPSAGLGRILDALALVAPCDVTAVEMAAACAGELFRQERKRVTIKQRDFLSLQPSELGLFDAVAMNPPFHMRSDIAHILHARTFLKPTGTLAAICMDTPHREQALRHLCSTWMKLDDSAFAKEGTRVETIMLTMLSPSAGPVSTG